MTLDDDIRCYFMQNYTYKEIQALLKLEKNVTISFRRLERIIQSLGLRRRQPFDALRVQTALMDEMSGSGQRLGCRSMVHRLLNRHGISVGRDRILQMMHILDPEGVELRKRHVLTRRRYSNPGPNFLVHIDGYDKLKRYGFAIHGAICGFSKRVLWLNVSRTNNDPAVVASFYLRFVKEIEGNTALRDLTVDCPIRPGLVAQRLADLTCDLVFLNSIPVEAKFLSEFYTSINGIQYSMAIVLQ